MTVSQAPPKPQPNPDPKPGGRKPRLLTPSVIVAVIAVAALGVTVARQLVPLFTPHLYSGTVLQEDTEAPSMDQLRFARTGEPVELAAKQGKLVVVFFGYTNCPDVCPASMSTAAQAVAGLSPEDQAKTEVWMVSVDPERDEAASLQSYVEFFNPDFEGIAGEVEHIDRVASGYGVYYLLEPTAAEGADDYLVDHTASLFGIGPDGSLRIVWPPNVTAEQIRADIEELL